VFVRFVHPYSVADVLTNLHMNVVVETGIRQLYVEPDSRLDHRPFFIYGRGVPIYVRPLPMTLRTCDLLQLLSSFDTIVDFDHRETARDSGRNGLLAVLLHEDQVASSFSFSV